jgi:AcrR family transcriptional regulator
MVRAIAARQLQREQTRGKLVEAALRIFATSGYEGTTVDDLAAAAGYSKGAYYFHFSSKEEILLELLDAWREERTARLEDSAGVDQPAAVVLMEAVEGLLSYQDRGPQWPPLLLEFWSQALRSEQVRRRLNAAYDGWKDLLTDAFQCARDDGVIAGDVEPATAAALTLAVHDGLVVETCLGLPWATKTSIRQLIAALLAPLMAPQAGGDFPSQPSTH